MARPRHDGFTLLEVLVALGMLAVGLGAAIRAVGTATDTADALHARQLAGWVAQNKLALLRADRQWPPLGETGGEATMGGRHFVWRMSVAAFGQSHFRRVDVGVFPAGAGGREATPLARMTGFLAPP